MDRFMNEDFQQFTLCAAHATHKCSACGEDSEYINPHSTLFITCYCGLARLLPSGLVYGETFWMVPCPACGAGFQARYWGDRVDIVI